jgi:hypothetical protein
MDGEKDTQQIGIGDDRWILIYLYRFRMSSFTTRYCFIRGRNGRAASVTDLDLFNAFKMEEDRV